MARKPAIRLKAVVNQYDEKQHLIKVESDIKHGLAHSTSHPGQGALNELEEHLYDLTSSWEDESVFEDAIEELADDNIFANGKPSGVFSASRILTGIPACLSLLHFCFQFGLC